MKPRYVYDKLVAIVIVAVLSSCLLFSSCTKSDSSGNYNRRLNGGSVNSSGGDRHHQNQPPRARAGADQRLTVNHTTLDGSASTDDDGTIVAYQWTKENGPSATIQSPHAAVTAITGLVDEGSYRFRLTVTDDRGATGTDTVHITVNLPGNGGNNNQPPVANAGADQNITLPTNWVMLTGSGSDPDGNIVSYQWTKISGNGGTIAVPLSPATTVTGLTVGTYIFRLKVTDNHGATDTDDVNVTVSAASGNGNNNNNNTNDGQYSLIYSNGYNNASDINSNQLGRGGISTSLYYTGPGSFRSEVRAGDPPISSGWRSEQQYDGSNSNPIESKVEYDVYYENWHNFDGGGHSIQWHPMTSGGSALVSLQNFGGKFDVVRDPDGTVYHQTGALQDCISNTWYHMRWEIKWSQGNDGYVRLYINNILYYSFTGATTNGSGVYLKVGQNRWPLNGGNTMQTTSVCYYDNLKIYEKD